MVNSFQFDSSDGTTVRRDNLSAPRVSVLTVIESMRVGGGTLSAHVTETDARNVIHANKSRFCVKTEQSEKKRDKTRLERLKNDMRRIHTCMLDRGIFLSLSLLFVRADHVHSQ